jgi:hypothetical protein
MTTLSTQRSQSAQRTREELFILKKKKALAGLGVLGVLCDEA